MTGSPQWKQEYCGHFVSDAVTSEKHNRTGGDFRGVSPRVGSMGVKSAPAILQRLAIDLQRVCRRPLSNQMQGGAK